MRIGMRTPDDFGPHARLVLADVESRNSVEHDVIQAAEIRRLMLQDFDLREVADQFDGVAFAG
jgi:hypothetical protein